MNQATFTGRLTKDPIVKKGVSKDGNNWSRCTFTIAVKDGKDSEGIENVDYIPCVFFGNPGETLARYNHKGDKLMVTGKIKVNTKVSEDGKTITNYTYLLGDTFEYMQRKLTSEEAEEVSAPEVKPTAAPAPEAKPTPAPAPEVKPAPETKIRDEVIAAKDSVMDYSEIEDFIIPAWQEPMSPDIY